ncbi:MAG: hypothetical protein IK152_05440 [Lachnospiraceae bacterium]|nr:hypothetical protein [Lachnospiraceae bacterium]
MYTVDGFEFHTEEEAEAAKKEVQAVRYIRDRIAGITPEKATDVYNRLVREEMLTTPVGVAYLRELREELCATPGVDKNVLLPIRIKDEFVVKEISDRTGGEERVISKKGKKDKKNYRNRYRNSLIINVILVLAMIAMFIIVSTSDNVNILNYRNKIVDQYEEWQKNLQEREDRIKEYEKKYNLTSEEQEDGQTQSISS